eukprot:5099289-Amphidinium_carterae.3
MGASSEQNEHEPWLRSAEIDLVETHEEDARLDASGSAKKSSVAEKQGAPLAKTGGSGSQLTSRTRWGTRGLCPAVQIPRIQKLCGSTSSRPSLKANGRVLALGTVRAVLSPKSNARSLPQHFVNSHPHSRHVPLGQGSAALDKCAVCCNREGMGL